MATLCGDPVEHGNIGVIESGGKLDSPRRSRSRRALIRSADFAMCSPSVAGIAHGNCLQDLHGPRRARAGKTGIGCTLLSPILITSAAAIAVVPTPAFSLVVLALGSRPCADLGSAVARDPSASRGDTSIGSSHRGRSSPSTAPWRRRRQPPVWRCRSVSLMSPSARYTPRSTG